MAIRFNWMKTNCNINLNKNRRRPFKISWATIQKKLRFVVIPNVASSTATTTTTTSLSPSTTSASEFGRFRRSSRPLQQSRPIRDVASTKCRSSSCDGQRFFRSSVAKNENRGKWKSSRTFDFQKRIEGELYFFFLSFFLSFFLYFFLSFFLSFALSFVLSFLIHPKLFHLSTYLVILLSLTHQLVNFVTFS